MSALSRPADEQYAADKQRERADTIGMWIFLASEVLLFGGLFFAILVYRVVYPDATALMSHHLKKWLGGANTAVLLTSSLTMALAVIGGREGRRRLTVALLLATAFFGLCFLGIKGTEYFLEYREGLMPGVNGPFPFTAPGARLFMNIYFVATGLHAVHLTVAIGLIVGLAIRLMLRRVEVPRRHMVVEICGLYWHLVDVVWIFLYPALYLAS